MSIGFGKSFQHVGLNRLGAYLYTAREKGPELADGSVGATIADRNVCATINKTNEIWRRITGIFPGVEISPKLRKRGLRNLARRIRERVERINSTAETQRRGERNEDELQRQLQGHGVTGRDARTTMGLAAGDASGSEPRASASGGVQISLVNDWEFDCENWARAESIGISVEQVCAELGCARHVLTSLMKEYCGVSAAEFLDGLKISRLRAGLVARLREAASELWGSPGSYAAVKLMNSGLAQSRKDAKNGKESEYFRSRFEEMFEETRGEERARRVGELCAMLQRDFCSESWAIACGYESGAKLKRACLNVFGRTLAQIERALAVEVVQFYLCAEDRELRAIACSDRLSVEVARAREIYHQSDEKPEPPFEDEWAKFEALKAEWLSRMWDAFG